MTIQRLIDNKRVTFSDTLQKVAPNYKHLSIATGFWDLAGTLEIINEIKEYASIRLLIGKEPISSKIQKSLGIEAGNINELFPDEDITSDLEENSESGDADKLRRCAVILSKMLREKRLQVKVFRKPFLHAKAFIFGNFETENPIGFIGSSNFTRAGLVNIKDGGNVELNTPEQEPMIIKYPASDTTQYGHLSWFEDMWNNPAAIEWSGDFAKILKDSPVGDETFGPYDVYIKTLMEVFYDELDITENLGLDPNDILYPFQQRNAGKIINKLDRMGLAMLSDSVGLGKTVTAGAVIKHYIDSTNARRIIVIVPAALKEQWKSDLHEFFGLVEMESGMRNSDYKIVSMQDSDAIDRVSEFDVLADVDLFVIDEAHNLRNAGSARHQQLLHWFKNNPKSKILLLTATPVNNSLRDFANQMQLASKGQLQSLNVDYPDADGKLKSVDFFNMLDLIQSRVSRAENKGKKFLWDEDLKRAIWSGLRHYLVRSTRQGVEMEGGIYSKKDGKKREFPKSKVEQIKYTYPEVTAQEISGILCSHQGDAFEGINPAELDITVLSNITQRSSHPLDFIPELRVSSENDIITDKWVGNAIANIFQVVLLLGFVPYRPNVYQYTIHTKTPDKINNLGLGNTILKKLRTELTSHNILHVTWLKRLESSAYSLHKSAKTYSHKMDLFEKWLDKGYILSFSDIWAVENDYGDDIERAFIDYEEYQKVLEAALEEGESEKIIKKYGVERCAADPKIYDIKAIKKDLERDRKILEVLNQLLGIVIKNDTKLRECARFVEKALGKEHGGKILVFSFFADTIEYLSKNIAPLINVRDFETRSAFISGRSKKTEQTVKCFAPKSKKYADEKGKPKGGEAELDFLFATDILSEGQNLQDAAILVNYDLHWNPVRMIQRNGRINRIGSDYKEVLIANMKPEDNIETFLRLVRRLERKIDTIKNTIGTDQSILGEKANPIEFIEEESTIAADADDAIYSDDVEKASNALSKMEDNEDIFSGASSDEFMYELREFLEKNKDEPKEIERIKKIPAGKWNYLPQKATDKNLIDKKEVLGMTHIAGKTSVTGEPVNEIMFAKVRTVGDFTVKYIDEKTALGIIRTTPEDNKRTPDCIEIDRQGVREALFEIAGKIKKQPVSLGIKFGQRKEEVLEKLAANINIKSYIVDFLKERITNVTERDELIKILNIALEENRTAGNIGAKTIALFEALVAKLERKEPEEVTEKQIKGVLYYVPKA
jgi:superfamily II DNA or RNA helicase